MSLPKGVVFDMDGTLLDTERIAEECFARACEQQDLPFHQSIYRNCIGQTGAATREILELGHGRAFDFDAFGAVWGEIYHATLQATPPEPKTGVVDLVTRLTELGVPLALATSSHRATVDMKLDDTFLGECLHILNSIFCKYLGYIVLETLRAPMPSFYLIRSRIPLMTLAAKNPVESSASESMIFPSRTISA